VPFTRWSNFGPSSQRGTNSAPRPGTTSDAGFSKPPTADGASSSGSTTPWGVPAARRPLTDEYDDVVLKWELETVPSVSPGGVFGEGGDQYDADRYTSQDEKIFYLTECIY